MMVVAVEPARKRAGAVRLAAIGTDVGPLVEQGPVEAFDLAVGLGSVGPAVLVVDAVLAQRLVEKRAPVAEGIVGQDPLDGHASGPESGLGPAPERGRGSSLLIGEHLGVGQAAVIVDGRVQVGVAEPPLAPGGGSAVDAMPPAGRDPTQLLDVDVDQLTRSGALVTPDGCRALAVEVAQAVQVVAQEHPIDGGGGQVEVDGEAVGAHSLGPATATDLGLDLCTDAGGRTSGATGAVMQPVGAELEVAVPPLRRAAPGDTHGRGHMGDGGAGFDPPAQQEFDPGGSEEHYGDSRGPPGGCAGFDTCTPTSGGLRVGGPLPRHQRP